MADGIESTARSGHSAGKLNQNEMEEDLVAVAEQLFKEVREVHSSTGKLSEEILSALNFVFQAPLLSALDLIDNRHVTLIKSPSGRKVYQVLGSSGIPYFCLTSSLYCSCPAYRYSVLLKNEHMMCKHTLAIKLADAMDLCKVQEVSDEEISNMLSSIE